jgi:hypothetical protein
LPNQRRPKRERIEYYITRLVLEYRRLVFVAALFLLMYALVALVARSSVGFIALLLGLHLLLLSLFDVVVVYTARVLAWLLTLGKD